MTIVKDNDCEIGNHYVSNSQISEQKKDQKWKGVIYINIYGLCVAICMLLASFLYYKHKSMQPEQLLFLRSAVATLLCVIIVNKNLKYAMYDSIEKKQVKNLTFRCLAAGMINTLELTLVKYLSMVFQGVEGGRWVEEMLSNLPGGQVGFLIVVNVFIFFLAFFLDFFEIAFIILPLLGPVANKLGIDLVWFGVLLCVNMQTSFMHPPFGFALFYLRGIADTLFKEGRISKPIASSDIYLGAIPWVIMQLILVVVVIFVPQSVTLFIDKEEKIDLDKVVIEMPMDTPLSASPDEQNPLTSEPSPESNSAQKTPEDDEQKRMEELFKVKK